MLFVLLVIRVAKCRSIVLQFYLPYWKKICPIGRMFFAAQARVTPIGYLILNLTNFRKFVARTESSHSSELYFLLDVRKVVSCVIQFGKCRQPHCEIPAIAVTQHAIRNLAALRVFPKDAIIKLYIMDSMVPETNTTL